MMKGRAEDGFLINIETTLRDSIKSFPYARSNLFQQLVRVLSKTKIGDEPSALSAITQNLNGIQSADFSESCATCGESNVSNKCSLCKMVRYCGPTCQKLHWSAHKKVCAKLKLRHDQEEAAKAANEAAEALACMQELDLGEDGQCCGGGGGEGGGEGENLDVIDK